MADQEQLRALIRLIQICGGGLTTAIDLLLKESKMSADETE